ncbi:sigma-70 family RNA polymerase sigma factor [Rhabdobacter roseus]|uniref:RNA polymerase sigma factor (Sigma-70 family) n=1 Tax=Rhabdobacter roseus TaxID=1655419 RepID=A0A840TWB0_9BACT|nr:sigma-70 family RNA polymerase sigma factor [Rhabdobacter roseus]MBB5287215.1 RNA polymerase sigma factor (sigma-70 family) [Rhabdobacter roseus]
MTEEEQLWRHFTNGHEKALEELIRLFGKPLALYGRKLVKDDLLIQDCIQEVYIQLWQYRANLRQVTEIRPYLFTCLRRKLITALKRERLFVSSENEEELPFRAEFSIEERLIENETEAARVRLINGYINQLPKRQKEAIYLRFFENMSNDEIATVMGIKYQTATNLIHEALASLRESFPNKFTTLLLVCLDFFLF